MTMKKVIIMALVLVASASCLTVQAKDKKKDKKKKAEVTAIAPLTLATANDSLSYAAGKMLSNLLEYRIIPQLKHDFPEVNDSIMRVALVSAIKKDSTLLNDSVTESIISEAQRKAIEKQQALKKQEAEANKKAGEEFLKENQTKPGVVTTASGLQYKILKAGNGQKPKASDKVEVIYEGKTLDGKVFDATAKHGTKSDTFNVGGLIKGWTEALQLMPVGSKWELYIPQELAYGEHGAGGNIPPCSTLIFTLELVSIK